MRKFHVFILVGLLVAGVALAQIQVFSFPPRVTFVNGEVSAKFSGQSRARNGTARLHYTRGSNGPSLLSLNVVNSISIWTNATSKGDNDWEAMALMRRGKRCTAVRFGGTSGTRLLCSGWQRARETARKWMQQCSLVASGLTMRLNMTAVTDLTGTMLQAYECVDDKGSLSLAMLTPNLNPPRPGFFKPCKPSS